MTSIRLAKDKQERQGDSFTNVLELVGLNREHANRFAAMNFPAASGQGRIGIARALARC
ncbi:MAG: hypothetical protein ACLRPV_04415 [Lacrimispora saccharolytica]